MKCPHCSVELELVIATAKPVIAAQPKPAEARPKPRSIHDVGVMLDAVEEDALNEWEAGFVRDLKARYAQYGSRTRISDKQLGILQRIAYGEDETF